MDALDDNGNRIRVKSPWHSPTVDPAICAPARQVARTRGRGAAHGISTGSCYHWVSSGLSL